MQQILVVGATGVLGSTTSKYFLKKGVPVKCFVRNKERTSGLEGAKFVVGDLADAACLKEACENVDIIITAAHAMLGKGKNSSKNIDNKAHKLLIDAAVKENVSQFIYTSIHGVSENHPIDFFRNKFSVEQHLINSGLNYTILRLPAFMEWHVHNLLGKSIVEKNKVVILGRGERQTNFIAVNDVVQVLNICAGNKDWFNKIISLAGPENITRNEIAAAYAKKLNLVPKITHVPPGILRVMSILIKPFHPGIARVMQLGIYSEKSDETRSTDESIKQFGLNATTIDEFISNQLQTNK
jgi:uncharacterized protein YbjT (DUF2867 family)